MQRNFPVPQNINSVPLLEKDLTDKNIGAAIEVHKIPGPGLLESAYQVCMEHESMLRNISFEQLVDLPYLSPHPLTGNGAKLKTP